MIECDINQDQAESILLNHGIVVRDGTVIIARSHHSINLFYEKTPWATAWPNVLLQMPGAARVDAMRFGKLVKRGIAIPLDFAFGGAQ